MADAEDPMICYKCTDDSFLKERVREEGKRRTCSYCKKRRKSVRLHRLAEKVHDALNAHFDLTPSEPEGLEYTWAKEFGWERKGEDVDQLIASMAGLDDEPANDIQEYLSGKYYEPFDVDLDDPYGSDARYEEKKPDEYNFRETWDFFRGEIRARSRFFSNHARNALDEIFGGMETLQTFDRKPAICQIGPDDKDRYIYRGRKALSGPEMLEMQKDPVKGLGPPPSRNATAGRMNASGISVFYGAMDEETCIAELRAPVGSLVAIARFEFIRPVRLLDFDVLTSVYVKGSYFDPAYGLHLGRAAFLGSLVHEISQPVMPRDEEFEYLPTQAVSEYLASCVEPPLDGIIFRSSQTAGEGRNIVLFNHASKVVEYDLPKGTKIRYGYRGDEDDDSIVIIEETPPAKLDNSKRRSGFDPFEFIGASDWSGNVNEEDYPNYYNPSLRLDVKSIRVFTIKSVQYKKQEHFVDRHRVTKGESK
ncbi:MAG: RES domain-containing protein [Kiloniellales bacterium]|nr:RES domain-containing protein [Kiloniellales bacterium]